MSTIYSTNGIINSTYNKYPVQNYALKLNSEEIDDNLLHKTNNGKI